VIALALLQTQPDPTATATGGGGGFVFPDLTKLFPGLMLDFGKSIQEGLASFAASALGSQASLLTHNAPEYTYQLQVVADMRTAAVRLALASLLAVFGWGMVGVILREHLGSGWLSLRELLPRFVLITGMVGVYDRLMASFIDLVNLAVVALGVSIGGADMLKRGGDVLTDWGTVLALVVLVVTALFTVLRRAESLVWIAALIVLGPVAIVCAILPQTSAWFRLWLNRFIGETAALLPMVVVLAISFKLMVDGANPALGILLPIAGFRLASKLPDWLSSGQVAGGSGMGGAVSGMMALRSMGAMAGPVGAAAAGAGGAMGGSGGGAAVGAAARGSSPGWTGSVGGKSLGSLAVSNKGRQRLGPGRTADLRLMREVLVGLVALVFVAGAGGAALLSALFGVASSPWSNSPASVTLPEGFAVSAPSAAAGAIPADQLAAMLDAAAHAPCGVSWQVLAAIAWQESRFGTNMATSSAGAVGYGQFLAGTWAAYGNGGNPYNFRDALPAMARYLCALGAGTNLESALWSYSGCNPLTSPATCRRTDTYVRDALVRAASYGQAQPAAQPSGTAARIVAEAETWLHPPVPYVFGGNSRAGTDCSGLVQQVLRAVGIRIDRTAQAQYDATARVASDAIQAGDLVFFARTYDAGPGHWITHVGIAVDGSNMIDEPDAGLSSRVESFRTGWWGAHLASGGRAW